MAQFILSKLRQLQNNDSCNTIIDIIRLQHRLEYVFV